MGPWILAAIAAALTVGRLFVPTVSHSPAMLAFALVGVALGAVLALLWFRGGKWVVGCVLVAVLVGAHFLLPAPAYPGPLWFIEAGHLFVGVMLVLLDRRQWKWRFGVACFLAPSILEGAMFFHLIPSLA